MCYLANRFWLKAGATRAWLVLPVLWVLLEWLRGWALSGFPWLSLGYAMIDSPLKGWAPLFGVYGVTWAAATVAVALNVLLTPGGAVSRRLHRARRHRDFVPGAGAAGAARLDASGRTSLAVAAVQGAVSAGSEVAGEKSRTHHGALFAAHGQAWGARLIVWPEAAIARGGRMKFRTTCGDLQEQGRAHGAEFAIGLVNYQPQTEQFYNGLLVLSDSGGGWYYKRHLVPFGEYFPVPVVRSLLDAADEPAL